MSTYRTRAQSGHSQSKKSAVIESALDAILQRDGVLRLETIVNDAKDPSHSLHSFFEWNDEKAAHKHRLQQARAMVSATKFVAHLHQAASEKVVHVQADVLRKYLPIQPGEGFKLRTEVLSEAETRKIFLDRKLEDLRAWCRSVSDIPELRGTRLLVLQAISEFENPAFKAAAE